MPETNKKNVETTSLVVFEIANEEYGIEIGDLMSIIKVPEVTSIPNSPDFIKGIIDLRGEIVIVIDLITRFKIHGKTIATQDMKNKRILVAKVNGTSFGLLVDSVKEIFKAPKDSIKPAPELIKDKIHSDYLKGVSVVEDRLILLLDLPKFLNEKELTELNQIYHG